MSAFAATYGLDVADSDPACRLIHLTGNTATFEKAFGTELYDYEGHSQTCRARQGMLQVPAKLSDRITAILGLDTRPIATPKMIPAR